jgi:hypothetical protein
VVTIYSVYNVVKTTIKESGPGTVFAQQWQRLRLSGLAYPDPHQRFISDLCRDIQTRVLNKEVIMLAGNFNEQLGEDPNLMASICGEFNLFDAHEFQLGDNSTVPTYMIRGRKRLDYCLLSPELAPFANATGINLFNEYYHSDHRALFIDIDLTGYLSAKLPKLAQPDQGFVSSSSRHVTKFIAKVHSHLQENRIFHRFAEYILDVDVLPEPWKEANIIDNMLGQAFVASERECVSLPRHPWPENLHIASQKVRYSKTYITAKTTNTNHNEALFTLADNIWPEGPLAVLSNHRVLRKVKRAAELALKRV